ncbi:MAG: transcription regulator, LytR family [Actinomycetia bacterium]|nr:transcription regulator, LytR family [Actinomycetes bacterium]
MLGLRFGFVTMGKVGYAVQCLAAAGLLFAAGYAHEVVSLTAQIGAGVKIANSPSVGEMNILVMGLESRTNFEGQTLSAQQLTETHSGNEASVAAGDVGAQDTDTLILIHIFAGGQKAVGFSIPRDDVVDFPHATLDGLTEGKIDAAYDYAYNESLQQTVDTSMSSSKRYLEANQAGQLFEIQTVESVTGVHIDHFVESNIIGFYELAQQFGGIEVCIKPAPAQGGLAAGANLTDYDPLTDPPSEQATSGNSGFNAYKDGYNRTKGGAQYLHLSPAQSLAYVRSRDTLPGVDIGRTARQQAAIDYVIWKLKSGGVLTDLGAITTLLSNAKNYLITDSGWDLPDFAGDMNALSGNNLNFTTLPSAPTNNVEVPGYPGLQSANFIDVPHIQQLVKNAFYGTAAQTPPASSVTVDVYNGSGALDLATNVSRSLVSLGYKAGQAANSSAQSQPVQADTEIFYGTGAEVNAQAIANDMGTTAAPLSSLAAGHVEVLLGSTVTAVPPGLLTYGAATVTAQDYASAASADGIQVTPTPSASASTQSVSAALLGTHTSSASGVTATAATAATAAKKSPSASSKSGSAGHTSSSVTATPKVEYGITSCGY